MGTARVHFENATRKIICGDVREGLKLIPDGSVQCVVTSPPYWSLRTYLPDDHPDKSMELGSEPTPEQFVANLVEVFREVRRVLREDGTVFLNIGDTAANSRGASQGRDPKDTKSARQKNKCRPNDRLIPGYKPKDLIGIPWMVALALRADGWYLRQEIIFHKKNPMPDSVRDRPTRSHEQIFLLTKSRRYFWDYVGGQEHATGGAPGNKTHKGKTAYENGDRKQRTAAGLCRIEATEKRNMRSVWSLSSYSLKASHFAAYPPELVRRCLSAGISEKGCCSKCGQPWERITEKRRVQTRPGTKSKVNRAGQHEDSPYEKHNGSVVGNRDPQRHVTTTVTTGWKPSCSCDSGDPVPCTVMDIFHGAGTSMKVSERLGAHYIGIELNETYIDDSLQRPAVFFPGEKKPKTTRKRKPKVSHQQLTLFDQEEPCRTMLFNT